MKYNPGTFGVYPDIPSFIIVFLFFRREKRELDLWFFAIPSMTNTIYWVVCANSCSVNRSEIDSCDMSYAFCIIFTDDFTFELPYKYQSGRCGIDKMYSNLMSGVYKFIKSC